MFKEAKVIKEARRIFEECARDMWPPEKIQRIEITRIEQVADED